MNSAHLTTVIGRSLKWCAEPKNLPFTILIALSAFSVISRLILILK
ncbi:MAG TPA: hypothetical protein VMV72_03905 [Verrucomicrobiae bacterium]|nr:hypothetical protein [Verrucomicrobiae bacterium]